MKKYEAVIILNPNLSSKVDSFIKDFEKLLKANTFNIKKMEDIGRRQLSYSINNHNKGHYLLFNIEGDASKLIEIENKIKGLISGTVDEDTDEGKDNSSAKSDEQK